MASHSEQPERSFDYELALAVWHRRKWLALLVCGAVFAGVVTVALTLPNVYRASATVIVERQQVSEAFVRQSVTAELETRIQTIHQQMMSRARLTDVINRLGLYPNLRRVVPMDAIVDRMRRDVKLALNGVEQTTGRTATIAFSVSYSGRDPVTVASVVNTLVASYVDENTKSRKQQAERTADFLKTQLESARHDLDAQERRAGQFKMRYTAELPQQVEANLAALDRLNTQLRLNGEYQLRALERRERLENQLTMAAAPAAPVRDASDPQAELYRLKQQLVDLRRKYSDRYPDVIRVTAEISTLERQMAAPDSNGHAATPAVEDPDRRRTAQTLAEIDRSLDSLRQEERLLRQGILTYETRVENSPKRDEELQELSRDYDSSKSRYEALLKRYEEAQLAATLEQGHGIEQFRVLDPAIPAAQPAAPNRLWLLLMGLGASVALGFATMVGAERLDTTFHSVDDLRDFTPVPNVAAIRRIPTPASARRHQFRVALVAVSFIVVMALIVAGARYFADGNEQIVRMTAREAQ